MSTQDIIRAWKDADYKASLSDAQRAALPDNPAGLLELTDKDLDRVGGMGLPATWACTFNALCWTDTACLLTDLTCVINCTWEAACG